MSDRVGMRIRREFLVVRRAGFALAGVFAAACTSVSLGQAQALSGPKVAPDVCFPHRAEVLGAGDPSLPAGARLRLGSTRLRHGGAVRAVAFSPKGDVLASAGWDGAVRFWDLSDGSASAEFVPAITPHGAYAIAYSHDGSLLAVGRESGVVQLLDLTARRERFQSKAHKGRVEGIAFAPDGRSFASASAEDSHVRIWDVETGMIKREIIVQPLPGETTPPRPGGLAYSHDGTRLALSVGSTGQSCNVRVWRLDAADELTVISNAHRSIGGLAFTPDDRLLITSGSRLVVTRDLVGAPQRVKFFAQIRLWDVNSGQMRQELPMGHDLEGDAYVALAADGRTLVASLRDRLLVWDVAERKLNQTISLDPTFYATGAIAISPDGRTVAMARGDETVHTLDLTTSAPAFPAVEGHTSAVLSVAFSPDAKLVVTTSEDSTIRLWNADTGEHIRKFELGKKGWVWSACISPDGRFLAASGEYSDPSAPDFVGRVRLWDLATAKLRWETRCDHRATRVVFSPDQKKLAVTTYFAGMARLQNGRLVDAPNENSIEILDVETGRPSEKVQVPSEKIAAVAFSPDGATLASAGTDRAVRIWAVATGKERRRVDIAGHIRRRRANQAADEKLLPASMREAAFSPSLELVATSGSFDDRLIVTDLTSGKAVQTIQFAQNYGAHVAFAPDGRRFGSVSAVFAAPEGDDDAIRIWDTRNGAEILKLRTGGKLVRSLTFSPDGRTLATGMNDSTTILWDVAVTTNAESR